MVRMQRDESEFFLIIYLAPPMKAKPPPESKTAAPLISTHPANAPGKVFFFPGVDVCGEQGGRALPLSVAEVDVSSATATAFFYHPLIKFQKPIRYVRSVI